MSKLRCFFLGHDWLTRVLPRDAFEQRCSRCDQRRHGIRLPDRESINWQPGPHPYWRDGDA